VRYGLKLSESPVSVNTHDHGRWVSRQAEP